jgi:hypothetical protein
MAVLVQQDLICYHCGLACEDEKFKVEDKHFCCYGCKTVFEILNENDLCEYYSFDKNPGVNLRFVSEGFVCAGSILRSGYPLHLLYLVTRKFTTLAKRYC